MAIPGSALIRVFTESPLRGGLSLFSVLVQIDAWGADLRMPEDNVDRYASSDAPPGRIQRRLDEAPRSLVEGDLVLVSVLVLAHYSGVI